MIPLLIASGCGSKGSTEVLSCAISRLYMCTDYRGDDDAMASARSMCAEIKGAASDHGCPTEHALAACELKVLGSKAFYYEGIEGNAPGQPRSSVIAQLQGPCEASSGVFSTP